jgi:hypothetical protein
MIHETCRSEVEWERRKVARQPRERPRARPTRRRCRRSSSLACSNLSAHAALAINASRSRTSLDVQVEAAKRAVRIAGSVTPGRRMLGGLPNHAASTSERNSSGHCGVMASHSHGTRRPWPPKVGSVPSASRDQTTPREAASLSTMTIRRGKPEGCCAPSATRCLDMSMTT